MLAFGRLTELSSILAQIGGISLQAHEAREEQDGTVLRKLPIATDPRFIEDAQEPAEETEAGTQEPDDAENEAQEQPETESPDTAEDAQETTDTDSTEETADVAGTTTTINEETEA